MLPVRETLTSAPPSGGICGRVLSAVGTFLIGSALHRVNATARQRSETREAKLRSRRNAGNPPVPLFTRASSSPRLDSSTTMASADFCPDRSRQISPGKNAVLHHTTTPFTSRTETNGFAVLCQLTGSDRPSMRFLFIGSWFSHSLPSDARSPLRPWPLLVLLSFIISHTGDLNPFRTAPMLGTHKARMINCLPATSRKPNERSNLNPEVGARCRQAVTSL